MRLNDKRGSIHGHIVHDLPEISPGLPGTYRFGHESLPSVHIPVVKMFGLIIPRCPTFPRFPAFRGAIGIDLFLNQSTLLSFLIRVLRLHFKQQRRRFSVLGRPTVYSLNWLKTL